MDLVSSMLSVNYNIGMFDYFCEICFKYETNVNFYFEYNITYFLISFFIKYRKYIFYIYLYTMNFFKKWTQS